jgi:ATP-binding cassette subfamily A (ABC1) protein 3
VFLNLAEEVKLESDSDEASSETEMQVNQEDLPASGEAQKLALLTGRRTSFARQCTILFRKRPKIIRRNYLPYIAALLIPIVAVGLVNLFLKAYTGTECSLPDQFAPSNIKSISTKRTVKMVLGPTAFVTVEDVVHFGSLYPIVFGNHSSLAASNSITVATASLQLPDNIVLVDSIIDFNNHIATNHANDTPG